MRAQNRPSPSVRRRRSEAPGPLASGGGADASAALAAARHGDLDAWHLIIREHQEAVFRSAYLATRERALAEETTKAAFLRAYRSLPTLEHGAEIRAWLLRFVDVVARARLRERSQQRDARAVEAEAIPYLPASPLRPAARTPAPTAADALALADAFDGLTDNERAVIAARYAFGLGRDAAAVRLDVEPTEVEGLLAAAITRLRARTDAPAPSDGGTAPDPIARGRPNEASRFGRLSDDQFGSIAMSVVMSELVWTPDVAAIVCDRLARETVAYGVTPAVAEPTSEHHDARATTPKATAPRSTSRRSSVARSLGLVAGVSLLVVVAVLVVGRAGQPASELFADVRSSLEGFLGETDTLPASAASDTLGLAGEGLTRQGSTLDPAAVAVGPPMASLVGARRVEDGSLRATVRLDWPPSTERAAPVLVRLEQVRDDGTWSPVAWTDDHAPLLVEMEPGVTYDLRVRSVDAADDEAVSPVSSLQLSVRKAASDRVVRSKGDWKLRRGSSGQRRLVAVEPGARVSTRFSGTDVAVLGRLAPSPDSIGLRIDDGPWVRDPEPVARSGRVVLFGRDLDPGRHSLDIRALADGLVVDAFLILRTVST